MVFLFSRVNRKGAGAIHSCLTELDYQTVVTLFLPVRFAVHNWHMVEFMANQEMVTDIALLIATAGLMVIICVSI